MTYDFDDADDPGLCRGCLKKFDVEELETTEDGARFCAACLPNETIDCADCGTPLAFSESMYYSAPDGMARCFTCDAVHLERLENQFV
jgi:hypothetical protein